MFFRRNYRSKRLLFFSIATLTFYVAVQHTQATIQNMHTSLIGKAESTGMRLSPTLLDQPGGISSNTGRVILPQTYLSITGEEPYERLPILTSVTMAQSEESTFAWPIQEWRRRVAKPDLVDTSFVEGIKAIIPGEVSSILDFGAGAGHYSKALREVFGASRVYGIEPMDMTSIGFFSADLVSGPVQSMADFSKQNYQPDPLPFDLVYSTEVLEHISYSVQCKILNTLALSARRWVVFSAGGSSGGHGQLGPRPPFDWLLEWVSRGYLRHDNKTCAVRSAATKEWLRFNVWVLERVAPCGDSCSPRRCEALSQNLHDLYEGTADNLQKTEAHRYYNKHIMPKVKSDREKMLSYCRLETLFKKGL